MFSLNSRPEAGRWVNECLNKKSQSVENIKPKLIILSGSNSLFGFSAEQLTVKYGISSVNASIHAGLGIDYILYYGKKYIAPGRVFVIPLEYELYGKTSTPSENAFLYQVIGFDPNYFWNMSIIEKIKFFMGIPLFERISLFKQTFLPIPRNDVDGYQSKNLNAWGDETFNKLENRTDSMVEKVNASGPVKFNFNEDAWGAIYAFVKSVRSAGGDVVLTYPNIYKKHLDASLNRKFFYELSVHAKAIGVKLVGNPYSAQYDQSFLFDTVYHQNTIGQKAATERLYKDLKNAGVL